MVAPQYARLHFLEQNRADDETAGTLSQPVDDARFAQIVWRHFQLHPVADGKPDELLSHFA